MKPLLILVVLCAFAVPQPIRQPLWDPLASRTAHYVETVSACSGNETTEEWSAVPQTAQEPKPVQSHISINGQDCVITGNKGTCPDGSTFLIWPQSFSSTAKVANPSGRHVVKAPKVTNSGGSIQIGYAFVQAMPYANPQTSQAPKLKEYPTLKACQAAEGLGGASNYGPNPDTTTLYDCQKLKDGNWAWFEDKNKTVVSFSSTDSGVIEYGNSSALAGDPQMMVPTMRDKVTHTRELGCEKGYEEDKLLTIDQTTRELTDYLDVCVKPSFIAQLRKAEQQGGKP